MPVDVDVVAASGAAAVGDDPGAIGVVYVAVSISNHRNPPLAVLDWDLEEITDSTLHKWAPAVFKRLGELERQTESRGVIDPSLIVEPTGIGDIIIANSQERHLVDLPSKEALQRDIDQRIVTASGHVALGQVKIADAAHEKLVAFKGSLENHLEKQLKDFGVGKRPEEAGPLLVAFANIVLDIFTHDAMKRRVQMFR